MADIILLGDQNGGIKMIKSHPYIPQTVKDRLDRIKPDEKIYNLCGLILDAIHQKDNYTATHCDITGAFADAIAAKAELFHLVSDSQYNLELNDESKKRFRFDTHYAAKMHDIGKIGVPNEILNKKGDLNDHEWRWMKKHPEIGRIILTYIADRTNQKSSRFLRDITYLLYFHHERADGSGYFGLRGDRIPLGSSIISIADSLQAMVSDRPYRGAFTFVDATQKLYRERDRYSREAFVAFLMSLNELKVIYERSKEDPLAFRLTVPNSQN